MLPSVKNANGAKTKVLSKREEKKRINIRWNSTLFFQVGLVVTLLLVFLVMESDLDLGPRVQFAQDTDLDLTEHGLIAYQLEQPQVITKAPVKKPVKQRMIQKPIAQSFTAVDDNSKTTETDLPPTNVQPDPPTGVTMPPPIKNTGPSSLDAVQFVPIFPGCESLSDNTERKACMSSKINTFINRKFNADKFTDLDANKIHTVNVQFTIGKDGNVKDIRARSVVPELETEAKRVIGRMPWMQPGKQGTIPVDVFFTVPIRFQVQ